MAAIFTIIGASRLRGGGTGGCVMAIAATGAELRGEVEHASGKWWVLVITGILWILVGVVVLDADVQSAVTIGYLVGAYLLLAGVMEFVLVAALPTWRWLHILLGVLFIVGGIMAFLEPFETFRVLAALVGFFLVLKGTFDFVTALATRHVMDLWWLLLIAGIIEIALGFWASGYPGRSAWLLLVWVGIGALFRGATQIMLAFQVRKIHEAVA
jgi:uncharacterized membrane protein HdeD (DUF308 family)